MSKICIIDIISLTFLKRIRCMHIIHLGLIYISSFKESSQQISKDQEGSYIEVNILLEILKEVEVNNISQLDQFCG